MISRFFHLYADGKTVKELNEQEWQSALKRGRHCVYLHRNGDIYTTDDYINSAQLEQLLEIRREMLEEQP